MAKRKNEYFELLEQQVGYCVQAANYLLDVLGDYSPEKISQQREEMHKIENDADMLRHTILIKLAKEFITPIDQEDLLQLIQIIDDVTDALDETVINLYMFHVEKIPAYSMELGRMVKNCVLALQEAVREFPNFKKPEKLHPLLVNVNRIESEADAVHMDAIHHLFGSQADAREILSSKAIYDSLENCCDLCEHAADVMEHTIMINL